MTGCLVAQGQPGAHGKGKGSGWTVFIVVRLAGDMETVMVRRNQTKALRSRSCGGFHCAILEIGLVETSASNGVPDTAVQEHKSLMCTRIGEVAGAHFLNRHQVGKDGSTPFSAFVTRSASVKSNGGVRRKVWYKLKKQRRASGRKQIGCGNGALSPQFTVEDATR